MPASTMTYDCMFELMNDTTHPVVLQLTRCSTGAVQLYAGESVPLILESGSTYYYTLKQGARQARISVRSWQDLGCTASAILSGAIQTSSSQQGVTMLSFI